jgi:H+/Cl- antiporter ClcA
VLARLRLLLFAAIGGVLTGLISWAFLEGLDHATRARLDHSWLLYTLPAIGLAVGAVYFYLGGHAKGGTPYVIEQGNIFTHGVPTRMAPLIWGGSVAGHLAGASVGREGAALQMAGSVTDTAARIGRLSDTDRRTLVVASLAGGWGGVFAVPFTGIAFAMQMTRKHRLRALAPAAVSAFTAKWTVDLAGYRMMRRPHLPVPDWTVGLPFKLLLAGVAFGLVGRGFVRLLFLTRSRIGHWVKWPPVRPVLGAAATIGLAALVGRDYLGLSTPLMSEAFAGVHVHWYEPLLKLAFTVIALGTGFVGGEVLPLFVMGSTLGGAMAPGLHASGPLLATTGSVAAFSSAAGTVLTGLVLTVEQFGWNTFVPAMIVGVAAHLAAGKPGLYMTHH